MVVTNKPIKLSKTFDNVVGLLPYAIDDDKFSLFKSLLDYTKTRNAVMYPDFIETAKKYMTKRQIDKLKKLINFKFKKHPIYNLPNKRLRLLEKVIKYRLEQLI